MGVVYTIGHSTRSIEELTALLRESAASLLVDVRRYPASRRHPQFGKDRLAATLAAAGIGYVHEPGLGGHRTPRPDSTNTAWKEEAFRGYADHMDTAEFREALDRVMQGAVRGLAAMCAEADPRRCHRQILADALTARGQDVVHILGPGLTEPHRLHPSARVTPGGRIAYDLGRQLPLRAEIIRE